MIGIVMDRSSEALSDGFLGDCFLDAHVHLTGETNTRAVDLSQDVDVLFVCIPVEDEIGSPDQRHFLLLQGVLDHG